MFGKNAQRIGRLVDVSRRLDDPNLKLLVSRVLSVQGQNKGRIFVTLRNGEIQCFSPAMTASLKP